MWRLALFLSLWGLSSPAAAATCAEMQAAFRVPPPPVGESEDPDGPFGCSRAAMALFEVNTIALEAAAPVTDLSEVHGTWLGDRVLSYLSGATVPGQEVLEFAPGESPGTLKVTQYWMKPAFFRPDESLWSEGGRYLGITAEATLEPGDDGQLVVAGYGEAIRYGKLRLEHERSRDLWVKAQLNHFELPFTLGRHEDVLVLNGALRSAVTRQPSSYARSYTRVAPGSAELALATVMALNLSMGRNFDCMVHQITDRSGPFHDVLQASGPEAFGNMVRYLVGEAVRRERLGLALRDAGTEEERRRVREEMVAVVDAYTAFSEAPGTQALLKAFSEKAGSFCPDFF